MRHRVGSILWGLFFIVVGVGFAGNVFDIWNFTLFFDGWWTLFIIIPCCIGLIQEGFRFWNTAGLIVGVLLLLAIQSPWDIPVGKLIWPALLILIGLSILFQRTSARRVRRPAGSAMPQWQQRDFTAVFGDQNVLFPAEPFDGGSATAIFGGVTLDLRQAQITHDVVIDATAVFGGVDLYLPDNVIVKTSSVPIFGGVSNKSLRTTIDGLPVVFVNGVAIFGGVDIR